VQAPVCWQAGAATDRSDAVNQKSPTTRCPPTVGAGALLGGCFLASGAAASAAPGQAALPLLVASLSETVCERVYRRRLPLCTVKQAPCTCQASSPGALHRRLLLQLLLSAACTCPSCVPLPALWSHHRAHRDSHAQRCTANSSAEQPPTERSPARPPFPRAERLSCSKAQGLAHQLTARLSSAPSTAAVGWQQRCPSTRLLDRWFLRFGERWVPAKRPARQPGCKPRQLPLWQRGCLCAGGSQTRPAVGCQPVGKRLRLWQQTGETARKAVLGKLPPSMSRAGHELRLDTAAA